MEIERLNVEIVILHKGGGGQIGKNLWRYFGDVMVMTSLK